MSAFERGRVDIHSEIRVTLSQGIASRMELERKGMIHEDKNWRQAGDGPRELDGVEDLLNVVSVSTER